MKKLLITVLLISTLNSYTQTNTSGIDVCIALKGFSSSSEAESALDKILSAIGASKNFVMQECGNVSNASALQVKGIRYIFYNQEWMRSVNNNSSYGGLFILAHEVGHHINGHALDWVLYATKSVDSKTLTERREQELQSDKFAGFVLAKLGASLNETTAIINSIADNSDDTYSTHPARYKRLAAIKKGYQEGSGNTVTSNSYNNTNNNVLFYADGSRWEGSIKPSESYYGTGSGNTVTINTTAEQARGNGIMYEVDGTVYKGTYYNGFKNGYGEMYYTDGSTYKGQWVKGTKTGKGIEEHPKGSYVVRAIIDKNGEESGFLFDDFVYEGNFKDDYPIGKGKMTANYKENKRIYEGQWDGWMLNGYGKITFSDGMIWEGNLYGKSLEGYGTKTLANGKVLEGVFGTESFYNKGVEKYNLKDYTGAITDFTKAIELDPEEASYLGDRGDAKYNLKDYTGAIKDYTKAIELDPEEAIYLGNRGRAKNKLKDYTGALADYTKAIELDPEEAIYLGDRANAKYNLKDYTGAIKDYTKAIELDPEEAIYLGNRGRAKNELKDYTGAITDYTKAIELDPEEAFYLGNRGDAKNELKDYTGAITDFTKAIELDPEEASYFADRARMYYELKKYKLAKKSVTKAIELEPNKAFNYMLRAWHNYKLGDLISGCNDIKKAWKLNPDGEYEEIHQLVCN